MKVPARCVAWLLPFALTACAHLPFHKGKETSQPVAPPVASTTPKPEPSPTELPPSASTIPSQPVPAINASTPSKPAKPPSRHRKTSSNPTQASSAAPAQTQQASSGVPAVSAIGELSTGEAPDLRQETKDSLSATERGLNGVNRKLSDQEQKTATQIREFLKQAHTALNTGDLDGARTLAAKAKVLLAELTQ